MNEQTYNEIARELDALSDRISEYSDAQLDELQNRLAAAGGVMV